MVNVYEAAAALCVSNLEAYMTRAFRIIEPSTPFEYNWHIGCLAEHLTAVYNGELRRVIFNIPPRTLKTTVVSIMFPSWVLGKKPSSRFVGTSFKFERAVDMSLKCRHILEDAWYKDLFPGTVIDQSQAQKHNFHTTARGQYYASAISSVTGAGGDYIFADDPLSPDEALSEQVRKTTNDTIRGTLFSRFNDPRTGRFILVMQRLHEDDPTGNLLKDGGYTIVKLPAEAYHPVKICLGSKTWEMKKGDLLFPQRLSKKILDQKRIELTEYHYAGQFLQEPIPAGGGEFKDDWIQYYADGAIKPKTMNICIICDPSSGEAINKKKQKTGDFTAFLVIGLGPDNNYYLLDMVRDRLNPTERVDTLFVLHRKWNELGGKPPKVGYEKYGMMSDTHYIKEKKKQDAYNFNLIELGGKVTKETRIRRLIPDMQQSRWWFPANLNYVDNEGRQFDLVRELVYSELMTFPRSKYDDGIDGLSRVYDEEMGMIFPRLKPSKTQKMIQDAFPKPEDNWTNW